MDALKLLASFREIPTGNAADAMAQLGIPRGTINGLFPLSLQQSRAAGYAVTIKQMQRSQMASGKGLATHSKVIDEQLNQGDLLVIDVGGRTDVCTGGAILALRAKLRGVAGYVINGCLRDLREIADLDFPVHLIGGSPNKSAPDLQTVGINLPVEIGGVQINPGDLVLTDDTGIVIIPRARAEAVLDAALSIKAKEECLTEYIKGGMSFSEAAKAVAL
ncbi:MAG: RraA family protein [Negativicutes bacterium]